MSRRVLIVIVVVILGVVALEVTQSLTDPEPERPQETREEMLNRVRDTFSRLEQAGRAISEQQRQGNEQADQQQPDMPEQTDPTQ